MADKAPKAPKVAKKPAKKAVKSEKSLDEQLIEVQQDLNIARKSHASGELVNPRVIRGYKKQIARIKTQLNAQKGDV